jgi:glycosyltransferase involved in cell wall biosynthesis
MHLISLVIPVYHNAASLPELLERFRALAANNPADEFEFIFVDDGSRDASFTVLQQLADAEPRMRVLRLTRNFGSTAAVLAGMEHARGDAVAAIAADLQDPPELLYTMLQRWRDGAEVVLAVRDQREDPLHARLLSDGFYAAYRRLAQPGMPARGFDFFLLGRRAADQVVASAGPNEYLMGLILWLGYEPILLPYSRRRRAARHGRSMWTFPRRVKYAVDAFVSFSPLPLRFATLAGVLLCFAAVALGVARLVLPWPIAVERIVILLVVMFVLGVQLIAIGVLGEYLWRLLEEVRRRPRFVVDQREPRTHQSHLAARG